MASTSSESSHQWFDYNVFLSFRGEDTRKNFVDHFYTALKKEHINTYKDDEALARGESIRPALLKAIEGSQIAIIIFSENYADSSWCLEELAHIMKCRDERGLIVMPIFYGVAPSEVRRQVEDFGRRFAKHEAWNINKVISWSNALIDASEISGWEIRNIENGHEAKAIKKIVDTIISKLCPGVDEVIEVFNDLLHIAFDVADFFLDSL